MTLFRKKVGLALSGGGPWGLAHIGVLKVLEENNISIDYIAGVSAGSIVGAFYSFKPDAQALINYARSTSGLKILSLFARDTEFLRYIKDYIDETEFKNLKIPFCAVATDLTNGKAVYLKTGNVAEAVRASCAVPVVFKPSSIEKYPLLIDGGFSEPVPITALKKMGAEIIIAVNLYNQFSIDKDGKAGFTDVARRSLDIMLYNLAEEDIKKADVVIAPKISGINWSDCLKEKNRDKLISLGEKAMKEKIFLLKTKLTQCNVFSWFKKFFSEPRQNRTVI